LVFFIPEAIEVRRETRHCFTNTAWRSSSLFDSAEKRNSWGEALMVTTELQGLVSGGGYVEILRASLSDALRMTIF
jgi:hypothetical protein